MSELIPIDEVVHLDVITSNPATGAAIDADSAPTFDVFEEGTDTPILDDQTMTKRTSLTGNYRGSITCSTANGFEAGKWYSVVVTAIVDSTTAKAVVKSFRCAPAESQAGVPKVDTAYLAGTSQTARDIGASVLLSSGTGTGQIKISSGYVAPNWGDVGNPTTTVNLSGTTVSVVGAITGITFPSNFSDLSISASTGLVNISQTAADKVWDTTTRILTAGTNIVLAKGTGLTGLNDIAATAIVSGGAITTSSGAVSSVTLVDTCTTNTDMRGTDSAALAATALSTAVWTGTKAGYIDAAISSVGGGTDPDIAVIKAQTDKLNFNGSDQLEVDMLAINGDSVSAQNLAKSTRSMITATVAGGGSLTEIPTSACSLATSSVDQLKGRVVIFLYNTTNGDLRSEVAKINGSTASATPTLTVTTLTSVPQDGDSLIIV